MSFLQAVTSDRCRAEQLKSAWKSLSYDIIQQQQQRKPVSSMQRNLLTPPLSPESNAYHSMPSPSSDYKVISTTTTQGRFSPINQTTNSSPALLAFKARSAGDEFDQTSYPFNKTTSHSTNHLHNNIHHGTGTVRCSCCPPILLPSLQTTASSQSENYSRQSTQISPQHPVENDFRIEQNTLNEQTVKIDVGRNENPLKRKFDNNNDAFDISSLHDSKKLKVKEEIACQVQGVLSLPGCREPRYNITAEELQRRVNQPECLTKVDMISYVRLAKNSARSLLDTHSVKTNQHNQRSEHTVLSKMCEAEAQVLAKGIREMNYRYFPANWFARKSAHEISRNIKQRSQNPELDTRQNEELVARLTQEALFERLKEDEITKCVLLDIYFGLERRKQDTEMNVFDTMSHTFGVPNLQNHLLFILSYLEEELRILKKSVHQNTPEF